MLNDWEMYLSGTETLISESRVAPPVPLLLSLLKNKTFPSSCSVSAVGCEKSPTDDK